MATETKELQETGTGAAVQTERTPERQVFSPRADVYETGNEIVVMADMPGVQEGSVDISLEKNVLTVQGKVEALPRVGYRLAYGEFDDGDYKRSFALSEGVDRDRIEATARDGVVRLVLTKAKEAAARKIPVKAG
ncbi:Hsp20/alpha crystallin family protein [Candidatus Latescibacterota bacterium]